MRHPIPPEKPQRSGRRPSKASSPTAGQEHEIPVDTDRWSGFRDSFGEREVGIDAEGGAIELLRLVREFTPVEQALSDRISRLTDFDRPAVARPLRLEQDDRKRRPRLILISDRVPGVRLSELLLRGIGRSVVPDLGVALFVMRRLLSTATLLQTSTGLTHFIVAPERVVPIAHGHLLHIHLCLHGSLLVQSVEIIRNRQYSNISTTSDGFLVVELLLSKYFKGWISPTRRKGAQKYG